MVKKVRDVSGLFEERDWDPSTVIVQDNESFGTFDGVEIKVPETFHVLSFCLSEHYLNTNSGKKTQ